MKLFIEELASPQLTLPPESCAAEGASDEGKHCHRWLQVQRREESRQDLHAQQDRPVAHTVVELLQKRLTNAGSDLTLRGEVVLLARNTLCTSRSIVAGEEGIEPSLTRFWKSLLFR